MTDHYCDVLMDAAASQITSLTIVYSAFYSDTDQRKHQNSASLAFMRGIHRGQVNSPHKGPVTWKMIPFDDVIMHTQCFCCRFATSLTYYGLSFNSVNIGDNEYLSFAITGLVEIPSYVFCILCMNRVGRKRMNAGCFILSGVSLLSTMAVVHDEGHVQHSLAAYSHISSIK